MAPNIFLMMATGALPGQETVDATGFARPFNSLRRRRPAVAARYSDGKTAFQTLGCLYRNLHSFTSSNSALRVLTLYCPRASSESSCL